MLDIEGIIDKHYDKKTALGEGLFGMAGTVLTASQQGDKEKAAAILGKGVGEFGKTLAAQKKERSKLGATLEGQRDFEGAVAFGVGQVEGLLHVRDRELVGYERGHVYLAPGDVVHCQLECGQARLVLGAEDGVHSQALAEEGVPIEGHSVHGGRQVVRYPEKAGIYG